MVCFTILGGHDALKDDKQSPAKVMPLSSGMPTYDASWCRHPTLSCPPLGELKCYVLRWFGEHDALKSDKPTSPKVTPLSSETPTFDANRCRHPTLTCPPLGSWNAVLDNTW